MCLNATYLQFGEKFYEQTSGLALGSPLSPILADLYMERMEQRIKNEDTQDWIKCTVKSKNYFSFHLASQISWA
jgi:hypothetical protein